MNKINAVSLRVGIVLVMLLSTSCAMLDKDRPMVNLTSFKAVPSESGPLPAFEITLEVINPSNTPLRLTGIAYSVELEGNRILNGVSKNVPMIDGFSTGLVRVQGSANLLGGIQLISGLLAKPRDRFEYSFKARIQTDRRPRTLRLSHTGELQLPTTTMQP